MRCAAIPISILAAAVAHPPAQAQDFLSVPTVVTTDPARFTTLFSAARATQVHAVILGDSQETCPLSHGVGYVPAFNAAWASRYGSCGRTPLVQPGQNFGGGSPAGEWLVRGVMTWPFVADPSPSSSPEALPGLANWAIPVPVGNQRGWIALLQPHATSVVTGLPIDRARTWLDTSQGVYLDVYALRDAAYGNVAARWSLSAADAPDPDAPALGQGHTDLAVAPGAGPVARHRFGPITWDPAATAGGCIQAEFTGAEPGKPARIVSVSFVSVARPQGLTATDIAAGGYYTSSIIANHAAALDHLSGLGIDCAFITFGANDAWFSAAVFKQNTAALIAALRARTAPDLPVVLMADPFRSGLTPDAADQLDHFPRACAELAAALPAVCAINSRRLTHEHGWTPTSGPAFLADGVHYNAAGATLKASLEVEALWNAFVCQADIGVQGGLGGHDGQLDNNDFIAFIDAFFNASPIADTGRQGGLSGSDGRFDNNDFVAFIDAFFAGCNS